MRSIAAVLLIAGAAALPAGAREDPQQKPETVFRSGADAVFVDVSVMNGRRPVTGLKAADFNLLDDGKPQTIDEAAIQPMALDVTVLLDQSGSVAPFETAVLLPGAKGIGGMLRSGDHVELVTFNRQIRRTFDLRAPSEPLSPPRIGDGGTALFDAIAAALMERTEPGQRHLIVALTDGLDTQSVISREARQALVARSNAVVYIVAVSYAGRTSGFFSNMTSGQSVEEAGDYDNLLREITDGTSGQFYDIRPGDSFLSAFRGAVDAFRQRYTLRYRPAGVDRPGWHDVTVTLKSGNYEVHARKGYVGGSELLIE
jgi:VWFA-related protein